MSPKLKTSSFIKVLSIALLGGVFLLSFNGASKHQSTKSTTPWMACIEGRTNTLHFNSLSSKASLSGQCSGSTKYAVSKNLDPIENLSDGPLFGQLRAGTKRVVKLNNGRRFSVSQWKNSSNNNYVLVLEPNLKKQNVRKVCVLKNYSDMMATRYDAGKKQLLIKVATNKNSNGTPSKFRWKSCTI